jgi:HD-like signal output (HDOD) protein
MIQGEIHTFLLTDLIQWLALTRRTGELTIEQDGHRVSLYFSAGDIAAATSSDVVAATSPEHALAVVASALSWRLGYFVFVECPLPPSVEMTNLRLPAGALLMEVTRRIDETRRAEVKAIAEEKDGEQKEAETFTLADALRMQVVDRLLREDFRVPPMPQLAARVLEMTRNDSFSLRDLGDLILTDQAIAAQILRYANSALRGGERHVDTLPMAVQRLGSDEVVNVVLAASLHARPAGGDIFAAQKRRLWSQSSVAAFFARALTANAGLDRNIGFLCGLLMDFGMTVLYSLIQDIVGPGGKLTPAPAQVIAEIIRDYHPRVGRIVGEKWRLPQAVIESMSYHHCIEGAATDQRYVAAAALADFLATYAINQPRETLEESLMELLPDRLPSLPASQLMGLRANRAPALLADLPRQLDQALQFVLD